MREEVADRNPTLAVVLKLPRTRQNISIVIKDGRLHFEFWFLAVLFLQEWLGIKAVDVRHPSVHVEENHVLRLGSKMRLNGSVGLLVQQPGQSQRTKAQRAPMHKFTTGEMTETRRHR